uniref:Uncharacterized protein n=1 Tax=Anguilla anguilla TaxID=7936 RepID=A0A0E9XS49_ANGAN
MTATRSNKVWRVECSPQCNHHLF